MTLDEVIQECEETLKAFQKEEGWYLDLYNNNATADHKCDLDDCRSYIARYTQILTYLKELRFRRNFDKMVEAYMADQAQQRVGEAT